MAQVVAFVDDLFFQSKIMETARHVGVELKFVSTGGALAEVMASGNPRPGDCGFERAARAGRINCAVARGWKFDAAGCFFSHVQVDLAERARAAGAQEVMPRSKFTQNLATILARAKS